MDPLTQFAHAAQEHLAILWLNDLITDAEYNERAQTVRDSVS